MWWTRLTETTSKEPKSETNRRKNRDDFEASSIIREVTVVTPVLTEQFLWTILYSRTVSMVFDCPRFEVVFGSTSAWLIFVDHAVTIVSCCVEISSFFAKNLTEIMFLFSVLPKNNVAILCICVSILSTCLVVSVHSFRKQMSVISDSWCLIRLNSCLATNSLGKRTVYILVLSRCRDLAVFLSFECRRFLLYYSFCLQAQEMDFIFHMYFVLFESRKIPSGNSLLLEMHSNVRAEFYLESRVASDLVASFLYVFLISISFVFLGEIH